MKNLLFILVSFFPTVCLPAIPQSDFAGSIAGYFEGSFYDFQLSKQAIVKAPRWDYTKSDFPPLSPKKAEASALDQLKQLFPEKCQYMKTHLISLQALHETHWIYLVEFNYLPPENFYSGPARRITLPVYFDGSVITPHIR